MSKFTAQTTNIGLGQIFDSPPPEFSGGQIASALFRSEPNPLRLCFQATDNTGGTVDIPSMEKLELTYDLNGTILDAPIPNNLVFAHGTRVAGAQSKHLWNVFDATNTQINWEAGQTNELSINAFVDLVLTGAIGNGGSAINLGIDVGGFCINQHTSHVVFLADSTEFTSLANIDLTSIATMTRVNASAAFE